MNSLCDLQLTSLLPVLTETTQPSTVKETIEPPLQPSVFQQLTDQPCFVHLLCACLILCKPLLKSGDSGFKFYSDH